MSRHDYEWEMVMGDGSEDRIMAEQEAAEYRATVREAVDAFEAAYNAETARLIAAGKSDAMSRALDRPRICRLCATVYPGGGHCTGTPGHRHREVTMYASNE